GNDGGKPGCGQEAGQGNDLRPRSQRAESRMGHRLPFISELNGAEPGQLCMASKVPPCGACGPSCAAAGAPNRRGGFRRVYRTMRWPRQSKTCGIRGPARGGFKKKRNCSSRRKEAHFEESQWNRASLRRLLRILESALGPAVQGSGNGCF